MTTMGQGHNWTGTQKDKDTMRLGHIRTEAGPLVPVPWEWDTKCNWDTMRLGHNGTGTKKGQGHNETGTHENGGDGNGTNMRLGHNKTRRQWDGD